MLWEGRSHASLRSVSQRSIGRVVNRLARSANEVPLASPSCDSCMCVQRAFATLPTLSHSQRGLGAIARPSSAVSLGGFLIPALSGAPCEMLWPLSIVLAWLAGSNRPVSMPLHQSERSRERGASVFTSFWGEGGRCRCGLIGFDPHCPPPDHASYLGECVSEGSYCLEPRRRVIQV